MSGIWSNDNVESITVPSGATTGPRIVIGAAAAGALSSLGQAAGILLYWNDTDAWLLSVEDAGGGTIGQLLITAVRYDPVTDTSTFLGQLLDVHYNSATGAVDYVSINSELNMHLGGSNIDNMLNLNSGQLVLDRALPRITMEADDFQIEDETGTQVLNSFTGGALHTGDPATNGIEAWHAMTLTGGWTNFGGAFAVAAYRKVSSPPNSVQCVGVCNTNAGFTNGTVMWTAPVGYRPNKTIRVGVTSANPVAGGRSPSLDIQANGQTFILGLAAVATTVEFNFVYPMDVI